MKSDFHSELVVRANGSIPATLQPARMGLAATLKIPQLPDRRGMAFWSGPSERFAARLNDPEFGSGGSDASRRAASRCPSRQTNHASDLKLAEFSVQLPGAAMVQLAADFTEWEKSPIDLIRFENGVWSTTVPLPPGVYAYRFLVDGHWYDDPRALRRNHSNAVIQIK